jgi:hypothetical protein
MLVFHMFGYVKLEPPIRLVQRHEELTPRLEGLALRLEAKTLVPYFITSLPHHFSPFLRSLPWLLLRNIANRTSPNPSHQLLSLQSLRTSAPAHSHPQPLCNQADTSQLSVHPGGYPQKANMRRSPHVGFRRSPQRLRCRSMFVPSPRGASPQDQAKLIRCLLTPLLPCFFARNSPCILPRKPTNLENPAHLQIRNSQKELTWPPRSGRAI